MKFRSLIIAAVAASAIFASTSAKAVVVDFSGSNVNMGNLQNGQSGTISDILAPAPFHLYQSLINGALPRMSVVTFTYSFPTFFLIGSLDSQISYDYMHSGNHYNGSSQATSVTDVFFNTTDGLTQQGYINALPTVSQVFATAHLTTPGDGTATGTVTFANYTQSLQDFTSQFLGAFSALCEGHPVGTINYVVSSIPLPASLPMMLMAMGGLFGISRRKSAVA
jgi:hypothetical protein